MDDLVMKLARSIVEARYPVVLTGAGVSTESGIPDFRGPNGLWRNEEIMDLLSLDTLYFMPDLFYSRGLEVLRVLRGKKPNPAHRAIARLEELCVVKSVITQNIDGLHLEAGSQNVIEIHGNLRTCSCEKCRSTFPFEHIEVSVAKGVIPPKCPRCGGIVRPDVVFFGDPMPEDFNRAVDEARRSDFMLVVGSSLQVAPAAYLPEMVERLGIINLEPTPYDKSALVVIHDKAGKVLPEVVKEVERLLK